MQHYNALLELYNKINADLPGQEAHYLMAPLKRASYEEYKTQMQNAKQSAVCICIFEKDQELCTILIERPEYKGAHSGQISFPGGKPDVSDIDLKATALREFEEETGFASSNLNLIGQLTTLYIPASNFLVAPYLTFSNNYPNFNPSKRFLIGKIIIDFTSLSDLFFVGRSLIFFSLNNSVSLTK